MNEYIRLEYKDCFSEQPEEILHYLNGISKGILLKLCSLLLSRGEESVERFFSSYFSAENNKYINEIWRKLCQEKSDINRYIITNIESTLRLYEFVFDNITCTETTLSDAEIEINILKVYLLFNEQKNRGDYLACESTKDIKQNRAKALLLTQMFQYFDITNYNYKQELLVQTEKAIYLYNYLAEKLPVLYNKYVEYYDCKNWQELMSHITAFAYIYYGRKDKESYVNLKIDPNDGSYEWKCTFIERLTAQNEIEDIDFRILRSHPFFKIEAGEYCVVYGYFLLELIYKGVYFKLNELNNQLSKEDKIKGFRAFYCDHFSERTLLYNVLFDVYAKKYIQKSGEEIKNTYKIDAEPDYYIRNGNKIYLFESKDILIPSDAKISNDYIKITAELKKRLYYEEKEDGSISKKAILQLLHNIKKLLKKNAEWDSCYKENRVKIYPIIILHDNIYNCPGINDLVNQWFIGELEKIKDEYDISRIEKITIINIDVFIAYRDFLKSPEGALDKLITSYHSYISNDILKKAISEEDAIKKYKDRIKSFEYYLSTLFIPDYKKLLMIAGKKYLVE